MRRSTRLRRSGKSFQQRFASANANLCSKQRILHFVIFIAISFAILYSLMIFITLSHSKISNINKNPSTNDNIEITKKQMKKDIDFANINADKTEITQKFIENNQKKDINKKNSNESYEYIKFNGYIAPQISGKSRGMFEQFEKMHDHNLVQQYCTALGDMCVGYAHHGYVGYQFYGAGSFPLIENKGWNFYLKHKKMINNTNNDPLFLKGKGLNIDNADEPFKTIYKNNVITDNMPTQYPTKPPTKLSIKLENKKYISYAMNVGRINNQLYSFEAMVQYAIEYNRTLVIPWPRHRNHVMGLECGMFYFILFAINYTHTRFTFLDLSLHKR